MGNSSSRDDSEEDSFDVNDKIERDLMLEHEQTQKEIKLLLLGPGESGKSTVFKQMKLIQINGGMTKDEKVEWIIPIHMNCVSQMKILVETIVLQKLTLKDNENVRFLEIIRACPDQHIWSEDISEAILKLWKDKVVKNVFMSGNHVIQMNDTAGYFFDSIDRIRRGDYVPSIEDILRTRICTTGVQEAKFTFQEAIFRIVDVGGQRSERRKWISQFDGVTAVIFCTSLSEYDQLLREATKNRMQESLMLFRDICHDKFLASASIILFLNKVDLFKEKVKRVKLSSCFPGCTTRKKYKDGLQFITEKFMEQNSPGRTIYVHATCALDTENTRRVFDAVKNTILKNMLHASV